MLKILHLYVRKWLQFGRRKKKKEIEIGHIKLKEKLGEKLGKMEIYKNLRAKRKGSLIPRKSIVTLIMKSP